MNRGAVAGTTSGATSVGGLVDTTASANIPGRRLPSVLSTSTLTREVRRTRPVPVPWDRKIQPRILLVSAAPEGLEVPLVPHVLALRNALEPWIWPESGSSDPATRRLDLVKERLRVLPDATIEDV